MRTPQQRAMAAMLCAVLVTACTSGGPSSRTPPPTAAASASPTAVAIETPVAAPSPAAQKFPPTRDITVPAGFRAEIYASGLHQPTALAWSADGVLYATENSGEVVEVAPGTIAPRTLAEGFTVPLGLAWMGDRLYVSSQGEIDVLSVTNGTVIDQRKVVTGLPFGEHQQDNVVVGPDGRLYVGSGSTCNACHEQDPRSAAILSVAADGSDLQVVAHGLRNPYGLAFQPGTSNLYASVNGIDYLDAPGDPEPADTIVRVTAGASYGWPRCLASARLLELQGDCAGVAPPAVYMGPHASADGIAFYTGTSFPPAFSGNLFVAEWGEYAPTTGAGPKLIRVVLAQDGTAGISDVSVFADGFEHPLAVAVDQQGALLVADWGRGLIYRIQAINSP